MANAELKVILSADGKQLATTMQNAERDVQSFNAETKKLPTTFSKFNTSVNNTASTLNKAGRSVKNSKTDFTNLSRVIQDLPFGLIGIQNNLTQLIPGVGLLGLAFSGLITALTFSQVGFSNWTRGSKGAGDAAKKAGEDIESLADRQKRLKEEFDNAAKSIIGQTTRIEDLGRALVDTTNKTAILTNATITQGLAQLLFTQKEGLAQKIISDQLETSLKFHKLMADASQNTFTNAKKTAALTPLRIADPKDLAAAGFGLNKTENQLFDLNKLAKSLGLNFEQFVDAPKGGSKTDKFFDDLLKRVRSFEKFINERTIRFANFDILPDEPRAETIKRAQEFIENAINRRSATFMLKTQELVVSPAKVSIEKSQNYFTNLAKEADRIIKDLQKEISDLTKRNPIIIESQRVLAEQKARGAELTSALGLNIEGVNQPISLLTKMQKEAVNAANLINSTLAPAFDNLFDAIKSGENPLKAFFQGIGQAVTQLIQKLIQAAIQALIIKALFPAIGGAEGLGGIFKSLLGFRAEGGPVFANKPYVVGERGPELFIPQGGGRIIPNNEMNSGLAGIGGGLQNIRLSAILRGGDLLLSNNRTGRSQNRSF